MEDKKDNLDELNEELEYMRDIGPPSFPHIWNDEYVAGRYEEAAEKLTDGSRRDVALSMAASHYSKVENNYGEGTSYLNLEKALEIYEKIDHDNSDKVKKIKDRLAGKYKLDSIKTIGDISVGYSLLDFRSLMNLPENLEKAGFPQRARPYRKLIENLVNLAESDYECLKGDRFK